MSQLSRFLNQLTSMARVAHSSLLFDLGSANTRVSYQGKIVYNQPTCATFQGDSDNIIQLGQTALVASDRKPGSLTTVFPIRQGYITDLTKVRAYISAVINQALQAADKKVVVTMSGTCAISSVLSPVEKLMLERVFKQAGLTQIQFVAKPQAVWNYLESKQALAPYICVMDIGSQTTEVGIFVGSECRASTTIYIGSDTFTHKIKEVVRNECQALIGWQSAEKLKQQQRNLDFKINAKDSQTIAIRAKNLLNLSPTTVLLKKTALQEAYTQVADELLEELSSFFAQQEPELVAPALEQGIYVTGGGSQLTGLVTYLEQRLKTEAVKSPKPLEDVIRGLNEVK